MKSETSLEVFGGDWIAMWAHSSHTPQKSCNMWKLGWKMQDTHNVVLVLAYGWSIWEYASMNVKARNPCGTYKATLVFVYREEFEWNTGFVLKKVMNIETNGWKRLPQLVCFHFIYFWLYDRMFPSFQEISIFFILFPFFIFCFLFH